MTTKEARRTKIQGQRDPIRIAPRHDPNGLGIHDPATRAGAPPQLTYRGGALLENVEIFTIFWGQAWNQAPQDNLVTQLNQFFQFIVTSALIDQLAEYNTPTYSIGHGRFSGTVTVSQPAPRSTVTDQDIQQFLQQQISQGGSVPPPNANLLYFVYTPPGVAVVQGGSQSCQAFCGYHSDIGGETFYAVMPYPNCPGCLGNLQPFDALTGTSSHELCEAITDAVPGTGWYDDNNGEIGDICAWQFKQIGLYTVQKEWSNNANACV